jgi:hypothetical protein
LQSLPLSPQAVQVLVEAAASALQMAQTVCQAAQATDTNKRAISRRLTVIKAAPQVQQTASAEWPTELGLDTVLGTEPDMAQAQVDMAQADMAQATDTVLAVLDTARLGLDLVQAVLAQA